MCLNYKFIENEIYRLLSNNLKIAYISHTKLYFRMIKCKYLSFFPSEERKSILTNSRHIMR